jgi:hypothetical protein
MPAVAVLPARMARPQIHLTHVHTHGRGLEIIRFVHAENVFEFTLTDMDLDPREAGAYFNQFLEYIGHPQRIFNIYDGGSWWEKEAAAFIFADKARFPEILRQLNHGDDLDILVETPPLPTKDKVLNDLSYMCVSCCRDNFLDNAIGYGNYLVEYYATESQEVINPSTQQSVAEALFNRALYLQRLGRKAEERASYEFIIKHFEQHLALPETIGKAWSGLGHCLLLDAKSAWIDAPTAQKLLRQAQTALETAYEKRPNSGAVLGNLAYVLWLSGEAENAGTALRRAFSSPIESGKWLFETTRADIATSPIPPDAGFGQLLQRVWQETGASA